MQFDLIDTESVLGDPAQRENISGIVLFDDQRQAAICSDEGGSIIVLRKVATTWEVSNVVSVLPDDTSDDEADLESLTVDGEWLYAVGSHGCTRKRAKAKKSQHDNRQRLERVECSRSRRILARVAWRELAGGGPSVKHDKGRLWDSIEHDKILSSFTRIPSKENGVDIEGLVVDGESLLVGFRGPVLRGNHAVVLKTEFRARDYELLYLDLEGRGIRDLCRVDHGRYLVLAGPTGDAPLPYDLYLWDGRDDIAGRDRPANVLTCLGTIPPPLAAPRAKPEGIDVVSRPAERLRIVVVYDAAPAGCPTIFQVN